MHARKYLSGRCGLKKKMKNNKNWKHLKERIRIQKIHLSRPRHQMKNRRDSIFWECCHKTRHPSCATSYNSICKPIRCEASSYLHSYPHLAVKCMDRAYLLGKLNYFYSIYWGEWQTSIHSVVTEPIILWTGGVQTNTHWNVYWRRRNSKWLERQRKMHGEHEMTTIPTMRWCW